MALNTSKTLDQRFASLDAIAKTKIELLSGAFDEDPKEDSNEEIKDGEAKIVEKDFSILSQFTKENKNLQVERIEKIIEQVKSMANSS